MKALLILLMVTVSALAGNVVRTVDGKSYMNCTMIEVKARSVVMYVPNVGQVEIFEAQLMPEDLAKIEPLMKKVRDKEAQWEKQTSKEKAMRGAVKLQAVTLINGTVVNASEWALDDDGETVVLASPDGTRRVKIEMLTSDWRDKVKVMQAKKATKDAEAEWRRRVADAEAVLSRYAGRNSARLLGAHIEGVRAALTVQSKVGTKTLTTYPDVILKGLPEGKTTGTWTGILEAKEVYQDRIKGEVYPVYWVR